MKRVKGHNSVMILVLLREKWELLQLVFFLLYVVLSVAVYRDTAVSLII